ncbi:MAG: septal ring lytic transglycosylase RlpA family protein, partial [Actinomycetospora chiangmaiensis]|nr:septal ring lytic transglycosylase RlpA family protein [Actinomycetospora chiangmaiensis]
NNQATKFAGTGNGVDPKYGVKASPRLYNEGDVIPKGGGRRYTGKPYVVAGETYTPRENPQGYVREGLASWYGAAFHGRMTANGEVFDRHSIAAAHPTLPLPSYVRVTNLENHSSMIVRVNDRGPYHAGRVMDVSEETAEALGFHRRGTARVRVEYVGKASLAGSDDRKLLATLRTDGQPASGRSPIMMADLGPSEEPERFERSAPPLAFKPAPEREDAPAETRKPVRAPIVLASAAVAVPAAVQPTALRTKDFKPLPVAAAGTRIAAKGEPVRVAGLNPGMGRAAPATSQGHATLAKAPAGRQEGPPLRLASAARAEEAPRKAVAGKPVPAAMPPSAKLAMARLSTQAAPGGNAEKPTPGKPAGKGVAEKGAEKRALVASKATGGKSAEPAHGAKPGARYAGIY